LNIKVTYKTQDWRPVIKPTPSWKRAIYKLTRPLLSTYAKSHLATREYILPNLKYILPERGLPIEDRRRWVNSYHRIKDSVLLIQGTGTGWDVVSWAALKPKRIYAVDLFSFDEWKQIKAYVENTYKVEVIFVQSPLENIQFLRSGSIDVIASDSVYEHIRDLPAVLLESTRLLSKNGILYASYGPLWFTAGGDHFSGRGGLKNCFNHIALAKQEYKNYFQNYKLEVEDFQAGGRYVEIDLFSKLTTRQYLEAYRKAGLTMVSYILETSGDALKFKHVYKQEFDALLTGEHSGNVTVDDLIIKSNLVILRKTDSKY
jgi:SAM-dependent methyltransferase